MTWIWDALLAVGLGFIAYGAWMIWEPLAFIVGGTGLAVFALLGAAHAAKEKVNASK